MDFIIPFNYSSSTFHQPFPFIRSTLHLIIQEKILSLVVRSNSLRFHQLLYLNCRHKLHDLTLMQKSIIDWWNLQLFRTLYYMSILNIIIKVPGPEKRKTRDNRPTCPPLIPAPSIVYIILWYVTKTLLSNG